LLTPRILAALLALLAPAPAAIAWGPEGHRMVGEIAARSLNARANAEVLELLRNDRLADGQPSGRRTLADVANWADEIKDTDWGKRRGSWHYDDVPLCGPAGTSAYCRNGRCASAQIARQLEILGNERASPGQRNQALKWIVHLIGDIHQPLHAANHADRGGNRVQVSFFGERDNPPYGSLNLHAVWDVHLVRRMLADRQGERAWIAAPMSGAQRAAWDSGSVSDWVAESHALARDVAYAALPVPVTCPGRIAGVVAIDAAYYAKAAPVIDAQLRKAGVRLARVLNDTLGRAEAGRPASLQARDPGVADDPGIGRQLLLEFRGELFGGAADRLVSPSGPALQHVRKKRGPRHLALNLGDDIAQHTRRHENSQPAR
jgi:hypothetical protein